MLSLWDQIHSQRRALIQLALTGLNPGLSRIAPSGQQISPKTAYLSSILPRVETMSETSNQPSVEHEELVAMLGIWKRFDGNPVLKGVNFELLAGEVHALVGENGAGKSTLMNILAGVHQPDSGSIRLRGRDLASIPDEKSAQALGIAIVFQERSLFAQLSVAENIFAARQPVKRLGRIDRKSLHENTRLLLRRTGLEADPQQSIESLSPAHQQLVEIAKALSHNPAILIFDEPSSSLTERETHRLFEVIRQLKSGGVGIIYISHRLPEVFQIADRVTVLKDGEGQGTIPIATTSTDDLVRRMVGRSLELRHQDAVAAGNPILLEVRNLSDPPTAPKPFLRNISFNVRRGEIVGFAGLAGAGRTELALAIFGSRTLGAGEIFVADKRVEIHSPREAIAAGLGYVPEDRKDGGLFLDMTVAENIVSASLRRFGQFWLGDREQMEVARQFEHSLRIVCRTPKQVVQRLSGGNQQKVALAKWLLVNPTVLIVDEPTRGVDVGAKAEVHQMLYQLSRRGTAVVVISSDLPEILDISDRIYVMREGTISGELNRLEATEEAVMRLASLNPP
jgi:ribose transport system ATP-binding protein